jgi:hypothetical protein
MFLSKFHLQGKTLRARFLVAFGASNQMSGVFVCSNCFKNSALSLIRSL